MNTKTELPTSARERAAQILGDVIGVSAERMESYALQDGITVDVADALTAVEAALQAPAGHFESDAALADWLDSLHETEGGAVTNRKWPAAQRAAAAIRAPAGEAVAYAAQSSLDVLNKCRNDDHNGVVEVWMRPNVSLKATVPLYTAPPSDVLRRVVESYAEYDAAMADFQVNTWTPMRMDRMNRATLARREALAAAHKALAEGVDRG